jgi:alkanesulfonate monooxygenase SsuD/methylene tetrahydromethanopterin reductase-like flavin-dependent oxidoreductase (luciferase family)
MKHRLDRDAAQARFDEGIEILMKAWTGETFSFSGKAWSYEEISCRPLPLQKPHPPIYYGATSPDSPAVVARRGWNLALSRQPILNCAKAIEKYREARAATPGLTGSGDAIMVRDIYVADTDEQAWREAIPELTRYWQLAADNFWRSDRLTEADLGRFTSRYAYYPGGLTEKRLDEWNTSLIGSPTTVITKARMMIETAKPDSLVGMFQFGGLKHEQVMHSLELFGKKVMPALGA